MFPVAGAGPTPRGSRRRSGQWAASASLAPPCHHGEVQRRGRTHTRPALLVAILGAVLLLGGCWTSPPGSGSAVRSGAATDRGVASGRLPGTAPGSGPGAAPGSGPGTASGSGPSTATAPSATGLGGGPGTISRQQQVQAERLVSGRWRAGAAADLSGWLAGVRGERLLAEQRAVFTRVQAVGIADPQLVSLTAAQAAASGTGPTSWAARAVLTYRIRGFDRAPRSMALDLRFSSDPVSGLALVSSAPGDRPQPWDLPGLLVRRSPHDLVLGNTDPRRLDEVLRRASAAERRARAVWGQVPPTVWVVPASDAETARLLGTGLPALAGVAAVTDGPLGPTGAAGADRVVLVPSAWATVPGEARDVVLTHELTHVAARSSTTRPVPLWLSEGFADYVAYRGVPLGEQQVAAPLLRQLRRDGVPDRLPDERAFDPGSGRLAAAYGAAWLAVRALAQQHGEAALVRFYRAAAGGIPLAGGTHGNDDAGVDASLRAVLDMSREDLDRAWRQRLIGLLAR